MTRPHWIVYFSRDLLQIAPGAKVRVRGGKPRQMVSADLDRVLANVARLPDGVGRSVPRRRGDATELGLFMRKATPAHE